MNNFRDAAGHYYCPNNWVECVWCGVTLGHGERVQVVPEVRYDLTGATFSALLRTGHLTSQREDLYAGLSEHERQMLSYAYWELTPDETARRLGWAGFAEDE